MFARYGSGERVEIDELDYQILNLITINARIPTTEIANKLHTTTITINNRIKKLVKLGVIQGFRVVLNITKLGYIPLKVDIFLKEPQEYTKIFKYIEKNPNLNHIIKSIGYADLELVFYLKSVNQLHQIMEDLSKKFPNTIKNYTYFSTIKSHKFDYKIEIIRE